MGTWYCGYYDLLYLSPMARTEHQFTKSDKFSNLMLLNIIILQSAVEMPLAVNLNPLRWNKAFVNSLANIGVYISVELSIVRLHRMCIMAAYNNTVCRSRHNQG